VPTASEPAGIVIVAPPPLSVAAGEVYPPLEIVTDPVGVAAPVPPITTTVTVILWVVVMLEADGVTVIAGVAFDTVTE
jgi:hypothetical protein